MSGGPAPRPAAGVYAALLTPRQPESTEADAGALFEYLDRVAKAGVDGLVFFGSTGEFVHFDLEERSRVVGLAVKRSRLPVLVNVSHSSLAGAVQLAEQAASAGASGLLLMPPYFYRYYDSIVAEFYAQFVKAVGRSLPVYLYNLPQFTTPLSKGLVAQLLASGSYAGIKDSGGNWDLFETLLQIHKEHPFQLLIGNEALYLDALSAGANGSVSGVAAALPELPVAINRAVSAGDMPTATALSAKLNELMTWIEGLPVLTALKQIAKVRSWLPMTNTVPLDEATQAELSRFSAWLQEWLPATLQACSSRPVVRS